MNYLCGFLLLCGFTAEESYEMFVRMSHARGFVLIRNFSENFLNVTACVKMIEALIEEGNNLALKEVKRKI